MAVQLKGTGDIPVVSAGTPVPLSASSVKTPGANIEALAANSGKIYIFGEGQTAADAGLELRPGESVDITGPNIRGIEEEFDLNKVLIDADSSGDKVKVIYFMRE